MNNVPRKESILRPCANCPWRISNQGKKTPWGFYTKANLNRLWNQVRRGCKKQSCHPTDPSHPDHIAAGAKLGAKPKECAGSVILVIREMCKASKYGKDGVIDADAIKAYLANNRRGLTKLGFVYWALSRFTFGSTPLGEGPLPAVNPDDEEVGYHAH